MNLKDLGQKIQAAREEKRLSQEQLASAIGCSQSALSNYEKGKRRIYLSQLEKLSEVLGKPMEYFVENFADNNGNKYINQTQDSFMLKIINDIYRLGDDEIKMVDEYIQFLKWKRNGG
jgi:transcriptional regulator with XRE-family HTH domain